MKLEIWLDYLSPLCYKQHKSLENLLKKYKPMPTKEQKKTEQDLYAIWSLHMMDTLLKWIFIMLESFLD